MLEKTAGFRRGDARGIAFAEARLAAGAAALRNMIVDAWLDSAQTPIGYPMVNMRDIESAKVRVTPQPYGSLWSRQPAVTWFSIAEANDRRRSSPTRRACSVPRTLRG